MTTPRLLLPEIAENQANKNLTHNTALRVLDALVQPVAISIANAPTSTSEGDVFIVGEAPTGDFSGQANNIAVRVGGVWRFYAPQAGWRFGVQGTTDLFVFNGTVWYYTSANRLHDKRTIASATAAGSAGDIAFDDNYIYICTNTNTWRRAALSAW